MDELARTATIEVLPKATSHASDCPTVRRRCAQNGPERWKPSRLELPDDAAGAAVFLVLLAGLWNMMRGTNPNLSQKLMRWRVGLQFLAIVIAMILVYLLRS